MKCEYAQLFINELADNQLTEAQALPIENHVAHCPQCKLRLGEIREVKKQLANIEFTDTISDQFIEQAIFNAEQRFTNRNQKLFSPFKTTYFAIAASFLIMASVSFMLLKSADQTTEKVTILSQQQLNLLFDAPKALDQVTFTVTLPENVEMSGFPGLKQVSWQGSIKQGKNLLTIPIVRNGTNQGIITTELQHNDSKRTFKINVQNDQSFKQLT